MSGEEKRSGGGVGEGGAGGGGEAGGTGGTGGLWSSVLFQNACSLRIASSSEQPKRFRRVALVASNAADSHWGGASSAIKGVKVF